MPLKIIRNTILLASTLALGACSRAVLDPAGDVALQQKDILIFSTGLMLLIIVPVLAATVFFAWHYRAANTKARYEPDWDHSTKLELLIWSAPLVIIICLGAITWLSTHLLDPYRSLGRIAETKALTAKDIKPLRIDVVALDWKWLFIYPDQGIATVNTVAVPVNRALAFHITASGVMNSFYVPAMAGQIYAMPAMETRLAAVVNRAGDYDGFSANYSGSGFSRMRFTLHALDDDGFKQWVGQAKSHGDNLTRAAYLKLKAPSEGDVPRTYAKVDDTLFWRILNLCVEPGKMCMNEMSMIDARGGLGLAGINTVAPLAYDGHILRTAFGPLKTYVGEICAPDMATMRMENAEEAFTPPQMVDATQRLSPLVGAGLTQPLNSFGP
ncbi:MAG: ubiquinol oxidase subunit II [Micavibrio sp.]|nr:ubiquinol oxidase subunit II [Micavibrio sp.]